MAEESYKVEQTHKTPFINLDATTGVLEIKGKSTPENSVQYYKPLFEWLDNYIQSPVTKTVLDIQLDYFNTSSAKCIVDIFKTLELIIKNNKGEVTINWLYNEEDEDMLEAGEDYKSIIKIPFNLVSFIK